MNTRAMLGPFQIDQPGRVVWRGIALDFIIFVGDEIRPGRPAETGVVDALWLNRRVVESGAAAFKKRTDVISEPKGCENGGHGAGELPGKMVFRDHERDLFRHAVVAPGSQDALHKLWLAIQIFPGDSARLERIVLEGNESQIGEMIVVF